MESRDKLSRSATTLVDEVLIRIIQVRGPHQEKHSADPQSETNQTNKTPGYLGLATEIMKDRIPMAVATT